MIRINLLEVESRLPAPPRVGRPTRAVLAGALAVAIAGVALRPVLSVRSESARLAQRLRTVDRELAALADVRSRREEAERRVADLSGRVALVEGLHAERGSPARLLDELGRALPEDVRLTELRQHGGDVALTGRAAGMTAVSDLAARLESSGYFRPPVEIAESRREANAGAESVRFELRLRFSRSPF